MKEIGTVKWFSAPKGYGFILGPNGEEVFVHYSAIKMDGYRKLEEGGQVEFETNEGPKGLQALRVVPVRDGSGRTSPADSSSAGESAEDTGGNSQKTMEASTGA